MNYYSIAAVSKELKIHESSIRRWEEWDLIFPERMQTGKAAVRIYSEDDLEVLRRAKQLMDGGLELRAAFDTAYDELVQQEKCYEKQ
jgi:MerR family transcriptional regulator, heat shock protein HspR